MILIICTILIFSVYAILLLYYRYYWNQLPIFKPQPDKAEKNSSTFVSVIIAARNEEHNIVACLHSIIDQDYPTELFEVIVVDDFSEDQTADVINSIRGKNIRLISLKEQLGDTRTRSYKKKAIETAISKSNGTLIVTTDADCIVAKSWLRTIVLFYEKFDPVFIAAPVAFHNTGSFLEIFQDLDFMSLQGITGATMHKNFHVMCNGANLAYTKNVFDEVGGFSGIDNLASGDDMLLMHKISLKYPERIHYLKSRNAIVQTNPAATVADFFQQRIRWASKSDKYADKRITAILLLVYLLNVWIVLLFAFSIFFHGLIWWSLGLLAGKTLTELYFLYPVAVFFGRQKTLLWFPFAQPFHIIYTIIAGWLGKYGSYKWKGRTADR